MFILKTDMCPCDAQKMHDYIEREMGEKGVVIPLDAELLLHAPMSELKRIQDLVDKEISLKKCCEYDVERKNLKK